MGTDEFGVGGLSVAFCLVKHTPLAAQRQVGPYKNGRPASFLMVPSAAFKWQILKKIPPVWCAGFDGSTVSMGPHLLAEY